MLWLLRPAISEADPLARLDGFRLQRLLPVVLAVLLLAVALHGSNALGRWRRCGVRARALRTARLSGYAPPWLLLLLLLLSLSLSPAFLG